MHAVVNLTSGKFLWNQTGQRIKTDGSMMGLQTWFCNMIWFRQCLAWINRLHFRECIQKMYHLESKYSQFGCLLSPLSECTGMFTSRFQLHDLVCVQQMFRIYIIYFSHHKDYTVQEWCFWKELNNLLLSVVFCAVCSQHLTGCSYFQGVEVLW